MSDTLVNVIAALVVLLLVVLLILRLKKNSNKPSIEKKVNIQVKKVTPQTNHNMSSAYKEGTIVLEEEGTMVLDDGNETMVMDENKTVISNNETMLLLPMPTVQLFVYGHSVPSFESRIDNKILIGRSNDNHFSIDDEELSRQHVSLSYINDEVVITDLSSTNGTKVNSIEINSPTVLKSEDIIKLGQTRLRIVILHN